MTATSTPATQADEQFMKQALAAAGKAIPSPNPPVGAVVVDAAGNVIGTAHHARAGDPHAEMAALEAAGERAKGGTLYATLEPCNHDGKTPPCVDAILEAGIKRVVVGVRDPNPHVEGKGIERLRAAGLIVKVGVLEAEAAALIEPWSVFITTGIPFVALKLALSLDGRIASRTGASRWVTGPEARAKVQELRAQSDAVAVGIGTALADDPLLTVRDPDFEGRSPRRIIFDSQLRLPLTSRLLTTAEQAPVWIITTLESPEEKERAMADMGCEVIRVQSTGEGRVDFEAALRQIAAAGVVSLLIEGGAELAGTALNARLVQRLHAFVAPILLGPRGRPGAVDWAGPDTPQEAPRILDPVWELVGRDAYVSGPLVFPEPEPE
ncbi:MAG: bifunctional diaminohydroxyphosphoribosylaminopyrimidine deaminase/5-amino-6-(5-phosphoribosylamino)uracil reductase RibD [Polyangiaceae bacterium]|nr:bifunctional diaminohydroxyphosphoribosylaminopyrimidine deaminase/5-amino-6-(5-phosphoribosylamino)uracil reductase RibD [Polyangiaceae bacterium]